MQHDLTREVSSGWTFVDRTGLVSRRLKSLKLQVLLVATELSFGVLMTPLRATTRARLQHSCALLRAESFLLFPYSSCGPSPADSPLPRCWVGGGLSPGRPTVTQSSSFGFTRRSHGQMETSPRPPHLAGCASE